MLVIYTSHILARLEQRSRVAGLDVAAVEGGSGLAQADIDCPIVDSASFSVP